MGRVKKRGARFFGGFLRKKERKKLENLKPNFPRGNVESIYIRDKRIVLYII